MKKYIFCLCFVFIASLGFAQSNSEKEAVNELVQVMNLKQQINESAERMFEVQAKAMPQIVQYKDVMMDFFKKYLNWETMGEKIKQVYAESFTEEEIRDLIAFYKTDTGQKLVKVQPTITTKMASISQGIVMEHQMELRQKIMDARQNK